MAESFLEEQIKRIRAMSARISESHARRAELTRVLEQTRTHHSPLEDVRDLSPCEPSARDASSSRRQPVSVHRPHHPRRRRH